jgi:hypothetical protein
VDWLRKRAQAWGRCVRRAAQGGKARSHAPCWVREFGFLRCSERPSPCPSPRLTPGRGDRIAGFLLRCGISTARPQGLSPADAGARGPNCWISPPVWDLKSSFSGPLASWPCSAMRSEEGVGRAGVWGRGPDGR